MKSEPLRLNEIDLLRGIACLAVVLFHFLWHGPRDGFMRGISYPLVDSLARYGYLGVHLFFLISGFVILMSAKGATPRSFFASRAARLYPALWVGATLTAGTAWILQDDRFSASLYDYLINLTMLAHWFEVPYVDGAYWSLAYELHFYIFVWLALRFGLMSHLQWLLAGWLLISAINAARPMWPIEFWLNAKWAPFFVAGGVFYLVRTNGITLARFGLLAVAFALAVFYALLEGQRQNMMAGQDVISLFVVASIITGIFFMFWLIAIGRFRVAASPLTFYAGVLTYPVYVVHQNFGFMLFEQIHNARVNTALSLGLMLVVVFLVGWIIHVFTEKPIGRVLRRALDKRYLTTPPAPAVER